MVQKQPLPQREPLTIVKEPEPERTSIAKAEEPLAKQKIRSPYSITAALDKTDLPESETEVVASQLPRNHFTETDLQEIWRKFLADLQTTNVITYNAIRSFTLRKKDEDTLEISYPSNSALSEFEKIRNEFLNHFMHKVNHFNIVVEFRRDVSLRKEVITKRKIFDKFAQINPVLREFDDAFKFDFD